MSASEARDFPARLLVQLSVALSVLMVVTAPLPARAAGADGVQVSRDLQYGTDGAEKLLLDVYQPSDATSPSPILILIHGGGWVSGDKAEYTPIARALASTGFVIFDINYSLDLSQSPAYPREVTDVH